jgi:hypothetical protein
MITAICRGKSPCGGCAERLTAASEKWGKALRTLALSRRAVKGKVELLMRRFYSLFAAIWRDAVSLFLLPFVQPHMMSA